MTKAISIRDVVRYHADLALLRFTLSAAGSLDVGKPGQTSRVVRRERGQPNEYSESDKHATPVKSAGFNGTGELVEFRCGS